MSVQTALYDRSGHYAGQQIDDAPDYAKTKDAVVGTTAILFGLALMMADSTFTGVMLPYVQKLTLSTALTASDVITVVVVVDGVEHTLDETYSGSSPTTLGVLIDSIKDLNDDLDEDAITDVTLTGSNLVITIIAEPGHEVYFKSYTAAGGANPTITPAITRKFAGISKRDPNKERNADGIGCYEDEDRVEVARQGTFSMQTEETSIDPSVDDVFVRIVVESGKIVGILKKSADSGKAVACTAIKFMSDVVNGQVEVALNF
jgi:hypothetical protein